MNSAELLDQYVDILNIHGISNFLGMNRVHEEEQRFLNEHAGNPELMRLCKTARIMKNLYKSLPPFSFHS